MASQMFNEGQGFDASGSRFQGQRPDPKLALEKQNNCGAIARPHEEDMDVCYEGKPLSNSFEGLEQKFIDDITKLAKEQNDTENARHREKLKAINTQYVEQPAAFRGRNASHRDEFLWKELHARQQQYQKTMIDHYPNSGMGPGNPHGYSSTPAAAAVGQTYRASNPDHYDSNKEHARILGGPREHGFEPRGPGLGGRVYNTGSCYY